MLYDLLLLNPSHSAGQPALWEKEDETSASSRREAVADFSKRFALRPYKDTTHVESKFGEVTVNERVLVVNNGLYGRWKVRKQAHSFTRRPAR